MENEDPGFMNDNGALTNRTREFYLYKTIQRSYNFLVMFDEAWSMSKSNDGSWNSADPTDYGQMLWEDMSSYHAISVDIPDYQFQKEQFKAGPFVRTFPVLNHEGFNFSIRMEEDYEGRVKSLIMGLTSKIINQYGYYNSLSEACIPNIVVDVYKPNGKNVWKIKFENCYFLKAEGANYDFNTNEKIVYTLEFNCDHYLIIAGEGALHQSYIRSDY